MDSIHNKQLFEIVDMDGKPVTTHFQSRKGLESSLKIAKQFDPEYHLKHRVLVYEVQIVGDEDIQPPRLCEDCGSARHVEGSEYCAVSYPESVTTD